MTKRSPVSTKQNSWFDSEQVDDANLTLEQDFNNTIQAATINNHFGSGVIVEALVQNILFDSELETGLLDGLNIQPQNQPTDNNFGNQLEIELTNSNAFGKRHVKVCVIGLDFESSLIYETFIFKTNEKQFGKKHFTRILTILFNDIKGTTLQSFNLGGRITIKEANPMSLSRDVVMVAQDVQPNLFFRDFYNSLSLTLENFLKSCLPLYNVDDLGITTDIKENKILEVDDVSTQVGQKFKATTNNIQKVTLLLSVVNNTPGFETDLEWTGDLVFSIYPLQSSLNCPTDIVNNLAIDFDPQNIPLAQLSFSYSTLEDTGIILDGTPQPVDFILSNTSVASGNIIKAGNYYAFTLKRSGAANKCDIQVACGGDTVDDSRYTTFNGIIWIDIPSDDLWFKVYTDAAKVSDGQGYESGHGVIIEKTTEDSTTGATIDYSLDALQFSGNDVFKGILSAVITESDSIPDQRTGDPINSKQQFTPSINLLNTLEVANLSTTNDIFSLGSIADKNKKYINLSDLDIYSNLYSFTTSDNQIVIKIVTDPSDGYRYDTSVNALASYLLSGDFTNAKIYPNANDTSIYYRIADAKICEMLYGDVNGDGVIDSTDLDLLYSYLNFNMNISPPLVTSVTDNGITAVVENGYQTLNQDFVSQSGLTFRVINKITNVIVASGTDGILVGDPSDRRLANFGSISVNFSAISGLSDNYLVVYSANEGNNGKFVITSLDTATDTLTIRKILLDSGTFEEMLRADIDQDFYISENDGYLLTSYIERIASVSSTQVYPGPTTDPYTKIGTPFSVLKIRVEKFIDRHDDFPSYSATRNTDIHPLQDIFIGDGYFASHNFLENPSLLLIQRQLSWEEHLVVSNTNPKQVPVILQNNSGYSTNECVIDGYTCTVYHEPSTFDPGTNNFYLPNNLVIRDGGQLLRDDGYFYKVDFEVGTIVLEVPDGIFSAERTINVFDDFIADYNGKGLTRLGFPAMRFADCSLVSSSALANDQLRFSVAVQSFSPNTGGTDVDGYSGVLIDGKIGVYMDYTTGLLSLNFTNLYEDVILQTLNTKIQIQVFLKKGGFNNAPIVVNSTQTQNMLQLISIFSGANVGGPSALVDLTSDVTGILPILNGGTGMSTVGSAGTVLSSNGTSYAFITPINATAGVADADKLIKTNVDGMLDTTFMYKMPLYIDALNGSKTSTTIYSTPTSGDSVGALKFRFDDYDPFVVSTAYFEVIASNSAGNNTRVTFTNVGSGTPLTLSGVNPYLQTTSSTLVFLRSDDISSQLDIGLSDIVYEVKISVDVASTANVYMARLIVNFS